MRILFYVEPVSFRDDHLFLSPILNIIRCIINANHSDDVVYGLASSSGLLGEYDRWLAHGGLVSIYRRAISEREILRGFQYDRAAYAKALFTEGTPIDVLEKVFADIETEFCPDVIVCFAQNSVLERLSSGKLVLFAERGPLSTWSGRDHFYFEPGGHQINSILARRAGDATAFDVPDQTALALAKKFRRLHHAIPMRQDAYARFQDWLKVHRKGRKVALIANQPHDSLLVAGATGGIPLASYMMRTIDELPSDWFVFATYHLDMGDHSRLDAHLAAEFPNFVGLPPELRQFGADAFADAVDALITVGSKAALPVALMGKKVIANRCTMLAGLSTDHVSKIETAPVLKPVEAGRMLAFLSHRYTIQNELLFGKAGHWLHHIRELQSHRVRDDFFLDASGWEAQSFDRMFGC